MNFGEELKAEIAVYMQRDPAGARLAGNCFLLSGVTRRLATSPKPPPVELEIKLAGAFFIAH